MKAFAALWVRAEAHAVYGFSTRLAERFSFDFHFSHCWAVEPVQRALALNSGTRRDSGAWNIYALTAQECDIQDLLSPHARDAHGKLHLPDGSITAYYDSVNGIFRLYDFTLRRACVVARSLPEWDAHSPFREFWHVWALQNGGMLVHSGVICAGEKAALLPAPGGRGKSTTVLSCLEAGMTTTGDDYNLLLRMEKEWVAVPLYANLKVKNPPFFDFPIARHWPQEALPYADKVLLRPPPGSPIWQLKPARIAGMLCPRVGAAKSAILPLGQAEALRNLAVSSILQSPTLAAQYLHAAAELARQVKIARLELSPVTAENARTVHAWLEETS